MFKNFILKLTGFCNLNCSYCYMFNSADQTFARKPKYMSLDTSLAALDAIGAEIARENDGRAIIVLHGGEPTLWPKASFRQFFARIDEMRAAGLRLNVTIQTNLWQKPAKDLLDLLRAHRAGFGISLDGPRAQHDAQRVDFAGHGTYDKTIENAMSLLREGYGDVIGGFLCVMQPDIDPVEFVDWIEALPVTRANLIWPLHYNQAHPPWEDGSEPDYASQPRYGAWLEAVFSEWWRRDRPEIDIRTFHQAVGARVGMRRFDDLLGAGAFDSVVINTDGDIELSDYFRTSRDGATWTGYSVRADSFETFAADPRVVLLKRAAQTPPEPCRGCRHLANCGGGTLAGRLDAAGEFTANPSVLCRDHMRFFDTVAARVDAIEAVLAAQSARNTRERVSEQAAPQ